MNAASKLNTYLQTNTVLTPPFRPSRWFSNRLKYWCPRYELNVRPTV